MHGAKPRQHGQQCKLETELSQETNDKEQMIQLKCFGCTKIHITNIKTTLGVNIEGMKARGGQWDKWDDNQRKDQECKNSERDREQWICIATELLYGDNINDSSNSFSISPSKKKGGKKNPRIFKTDVHLKLYGERSFGSYSSLTDMRQDKKKKNSI